MHVSHYVNHKQFLFEISNTRSSNSGPKPDADIWQSPICVQKNKENPALCTAVIAVYFLAQVRSSWDLICSVTTELQRFENSTRPWANSSTNNYKRRVQIFKEKEEGNQLSASLKKKRKEKRCRWFIAYQFISEKNQALRAYEAKREREQKLIFSSFKGTLSSSAGMGYVDLQRATKGQSVPIPLLSGEQLRCLMLVIYPKLEQIMHFREGEAKNLQWERTIAHIPIRQLQDKNIVTFGLLCISQSGDTELSQDLPLNCSSPLLWSGQSQVQKLRSKRSFLYASLADSDKEEEDEAWLESIGVKKRHRGVVRIKK